MNMIYLKDNIGKVVGSWRVPNDPDKSVKAAQELMDTDIGWHVLYMFATGATDVHAYLEEVDESI